MKGKSIVILGVLAGLVLVAPASAQYTSIQHNLLDGFGDSSFDPNTGAFIIDADAALAPGVNNLTLNDPAALTGTITNTRIHIETTFNQIIGTQAQFVGGTLSLTFDFDGIPREISGPITGMLFDPPQQLSPTVWKIDGIGRWTATTVNLPGSGNWPDGGGFSSLDSLTLAFNQNLAGFDWENDALDGRVESQYSLYPNDSATPEPASLLLLALGGAAVLRRRS